MRCKISSTPSVASAASTGVDAAARELRVDAMDGRLVRHPPGPEPDGLVRRPPRRRWRGRLALVEHLQQPRVRVAEPRDGLVGLRPLRRPRIGRVPQPRALDLVLVDLRHMRDEIADRPARARRHRGGSSPSAASASRDRRCERVPRSWRTPSVHPSRGPERAAATLSCGYGTAGELRHRVRDRHAGGPQRRRSGRPRDPPAVRLQEHEHLARAQGGGDRAGLRHRGSPEGRLPGARGEGVRRQVPLKALQPGAVEPAAKGSVRQTIKLVTGISDEKAKEISKFVRQAVPKIQTQIQGSQVRVIEQVQERPPGRDRRLQGPRLRHRPAVHELPLIGLRPLPLRGRRHPTYTRGLPRGCLRCPST